MYRPHAVVGSSLYLSTSSFLLISILPFHRNLVPRLFTSPFYESRPLSSTVAASGFWGQSTSDHLTCLCLFVRQRKLCCLVLFFIWEVGVYEILFGWVGTTGQLLCSWIRSDRFNGSVSSGKIGSVFCKTEFLFLFFKFACYLVGLVRFV
jgi:hypothetical protein